MLSTNSFFIFTIIILNIAKLYNAISLNDLDSAEESLEAEEINKQPDKCESDPHNEGSVQDCSPAVYFDDNCILPIDIETAESQAILKDIGKPALRYGFQRTKDCQNFAKAFLCVRKCLDLNYDSAYSNKTCHCTCFRVRDLNAHKIPTGPPKDTYKKGYPSTKKPYWIQGLINPDTEPPPDTTPNDDDDDDGSGDEGGDSKNSGGGGGDAGSGGGADGDTTGAGGATGAGDATGAGGATAAGGDTTGGGGAATTAAGGDAAASTAAA